MLFANIRIVLVNTSHPGNIGAAVRAMKTMGFHQLILVNPKSFPDARATERAAQAADMLGKIIVTQTLPEAIQDCQIVFGTSTRNRGLAWPLYHSREAAEKISAMASDGTQIAVVFGNEQSGLSNDELQYCHFQIEIPANPEYSSLNLAAAVQIVCYELRMAFHQSITVAKLSAKKNSDELATSAELENFYDHFENVLYKIDFLKLTRSTRIIHRLHRIFNRAQLEKREVNILRGILTAMEKSLDS
jgi:tRNA (cytidine32/uridine32-2'-O)-methyltransferase